jgi:hypothetical protein
MGVFLCVSQLCCCGVHRQGAGHQECPGSPPFCLCPSLPNLLSFPGIVSKQDGYDGEGATFPEGTSREEQGGREQFCRTAPPGYCRGERALFAFRPLFLPQGVQSRACLDQEKAVRGSVTGHTVWSWSSLNRFGRKNERSGLRVERATSRLLPGFLHPCAGPSTGGAIAAVMHSRRWPVRAPGKIGMRIAISGGVRLLADQPG